MTLLQWQNSQPDQDIPNVKHQLIGNQPDGPPTDMECDHPPEEMITANDLAPHQENEVTYSTGT